MKNKDKQLPKLTPAMREAKKLKILRAMKANPEFEKEVMRRAEKKNNNK